MKSITDAVLDGMAELGAADRHVEAQEGDYIGGDGYLHCGTCGERKEFRLPINGHFVPSLCACGVAKRAQREYEWQMQQERYRVEQLASYSLIDDEFRSARFENFVVRDNRDARLLRICKNYVERFDEMAENNVGLLLSGRPGTGKSFAASCIANALMDRGVPVLVTSIVRLTANPYGEELPHLIEKMRAARLLILDDFGAERDTSTRAEQVFSVIDARVNSRRPMVITTNILDFRDETNIRRKRVYDRIAGACLPVNVNGESRRVANANRRRADLMALLEEE